MTTDPSWTQHFRKLERMYLCAPIQSLYPNTNIDISHNKAVITLPIETRYFHAAQAVHGSVYFRLLDDSAFFAVQSTQRIYFVLTKSFQVKLTRPVHSGLLTAQGEFESLESGDLIASSILFNHHKKEIGFGRGVFVKSKIRLINELGFE